MKQIDGKALDQLPGKKIKENETFSFQCHAGLSCFNQCCRNLNLMLYPYDVVRLKRCLDMSSDQFIDRYVDIILRPSDPFPAVLLKMSDNDEKACPFLTDAGCSVYTDRPNACRTFPIEQGVVFKEESDQTQFFFLFRPPDFCLGQYEKKSWIPRMWLKDQEKLGKKTIL